jgi:cobalamin biosynthesis Mg chelatase CobN
MKLILEIDLEDAMHNSPDPPQNEWSEQEFEEDLIEKLRDYLEELERDTGALITLKDENGKYL